MCLALDLVLGYIDKFESLPSQRSQLMWRRILIKYARAKVKTGMWKVVILPGVRRLARKTDGRAEISGKRKH